MADRAAEPRYRLAAFDFDGTLADTMPWFESVLDDLAERHGFRKPDPSERARLRQRSAQEILASLQVPFWKLPAIMLDVRARMSDIRQHVRLFHGIAEALAALKQSGLKLAMVSSNSLENVQSVLGPDLCALFDDFECGTDMFGKPAKLQRLLERHQLAPEALILVGDELRDIEAARKTGVHAGSVAWGYNDAQALRDGSPDLLFNQVSDIAALLGPISPQRP